MAASGVLFSRSKDSRSSMEEDESDNPWDDTLLIQAYDRAVNLAKANLQKNLVNSNEVNNSKKGDKVNESFKEPKTKLREPPSVSSSAANGGWKIGSKCRAVWSYDEIEYEAEIVNLKTPRNQARVKFIGYNNEENVKISNLKPSLGESARQKQLLDSQCDAEESGFVPTSPLENNATQEGIMFPPPPPPHVISYLPKDEQEALSAMLMSWYMSGYHTGYYQGLIAAGSSPNKKK